MYVVGIPEIYGYCGQFVRQFRLRRLAVAKYIKLIRRTSWTYCKR
jgi:hypothetical protein